MDEAHKDKRRKVDFSKYRSTAHVLPQSNLCERLFSLAKLILTDLRQSMNPSTLTDILFLKSKLRLKGVKLNISTGFLSSVFILIFSSILCFFSKLKRAAKTLLTCQKSGRKNKMCLYTKSTSIQSWKSKSKREFKTTWLFEPSHFSFSSLPFSVLKDFKPP